MAEIKARVDPALKKKITSMAKKKKMTQNDFINLHLKRITTPNLFQEEKNRFEEMLGMHIEVFATFAKSNEELLKKLISIEGILNQEVQKVFEQEVNE
ncbi:hypothetical protein Q8G28_10575 [Lysinibacillus capsici]|uniref:Uncharacterized protein n=2 Tax=Lysinibacillus capsici TaxID=2115968 RepID=A0ABY8KHT6_9BACI|nr:MULTISPECIES: hypothetical protein [Lysinibacillus]MDP1393492.1 hypothetical protein [Lysinibacillus capsici]MDP1414306.1 hypothetical protein [Lysinibacillus capsici]MDP1430198.1 hypothetical protein [Lysinibacillus capsici]MED4700543.1 hypothetical protein [Lysinibacillus capsici]OCX64134.1 hypothetical protein BFM98_11765 [Lysinibacillus sp. AR18-8]